MVRVTELAYPPFRAMPCKCVLPISRAWREANSTPGCGTGSFYEENLMGPFCHTAVKPAFPGLCLPARLHRSLRSWGFSFLLSHSFLLLSLLPTTPSSFLLPVFPLLCLNKNFLDDAIFQVSETERAEALPNPKQV